MSRIKNGIKLQDGATLQYTVDLNEIDSISFTTYEWLDDMYDEVRFTRDEPNENSRYTMTSSIGDLVADVLLLEESEQVIQIKLDELVTKIMRHPSAYNIDDEVFIETYM